MSKRFKNTIERKIVEKTEKEKKVRVFLKWKCCWITNQT